MINTECYGRLSIQITWETWIINTGQKCTQGIQQPLEENVLKPWKSYLYN